MSSKIKVDTIENVAGSGNVSLGSGHNLVVPGNITGQGTAAITSNATVGGTLGVGSTNTPTSSSGGKLIAIETTADEHTNLVFNTANTARNGIIEGRRTGRSGSERFAQINIQNNSDNGEIRFYTAASGSDVSEKMKIDASGHVTKPLQPAFSVLGNSTDTTLNTNGTDIDIPLNTSLVYNIGSNYNTSNSRFTAPVAGRYLFYAECMLKTNVDNWNYMIISFKKNGSATGIEHMYPRSNGGSFASSGVTAVLNLAVGDYVTVWMRQSGGTGNAVVRNDYRQFIGYFLG